MPKWLLIPDAKRPGVYTVNIENEPYNGDFVSLVKKLQNMIVANLSHRPNTFKQKGEGKETENLSKEDTGRSKER